jgi:GTP:adenosylcobinamide-phosphate guanylyltransferase
VSGLLQGGILAAGKGSRLKRDGWSVAKPLVSIGGVPLLEHVLANFQAAGVRRVAIIFNETEQACADFARRRFPDLELSILLRTTASSLESLRALALLLGGGPALVSTVDAWCPRQDFLAFARVAREAGEQETILAVTPYVDDEKPLWARLDGAGRITELGSASGHAVTAGMYVFPERILRREGLPQLPRLRDFLIHLSASGETIRAVTIPKVVDVDRGADVRQAEAMEDSGARKTRGSRAERRLRAWGVYRELAHSPGRENDDAEILRATGRRLADLGFEVTFKTPEEAAGAGDDSVPPLLFVMCEREAIVSRLARWEAAGACVVNRPAAIRNTDRERTIARLCGDGIPFPASILVPTGEPARALPLTFPCWVKRGDVHATQAEDVAFAAGAAELARRLDGLSARGISRAVLQEHVPGDLIKFYGVAGADADGAPLSWFQWFYHRDQTLAHHPFDPERLRSAVARAAAALGLDVFGGDAIATASADTILIDVNAWPSFALYRETAAEKIAARIGGRFRAAAEKRP